ncbi:hypothetical protein D3C85_1184010 [compost metagenome]
MDDFGTQGIVALVLVQGDHTDHHAAQYQGHHAEHDEQEPAGARDGADLGHRGQHGPRIRLTGHHMGAGQGVVHGALAKNGLLYVVEDAGQDHVQCVLQRMPPDRAQQPGRAALARYDPQLQEPLAGGPVAPGVHEGGQQPARQAGGDCHQHGPVCSGQSLIGV